MEIRTRVACAFAVAALAACSGGGASSAAPSGSFAPSAMPQQTSGTLTIGVAPNTVSSVARSPAFVASATKHATLFIDGAAAASGTSTCATAGTSGGTGTTACSIPWTAQISVPASHVFAVEIDSGSTGSPANTVLGEGKGTYAVVAGGSNALGTLTLNGTVADVTFTIASCTTTTCLGLAQLASAGGNLISYTGTVTVPTISVNPTNGTVFDNGSVTFVSSNALAGTGGVVTGTAQTSGANTYSTYATNTLTASGVFSGTSSAYASGAYTFAATCNATATGSFGITSSLVGSPSLDVTAAELAALSPAVAYPSGITVLTTAPAFTCTSGTIGDATASIPAN